MITPLQTWIVIVAVLAAAIALRMAHFLLNHHRASHRHDILSMSSERDIMYLPGDPLKANTEDYDDSDDM